MATAGIRILREEGLLVKHVSKFTKTIWGTVGVCLNVCVCVQGFIQYFEFWEGGTPKFGVDVEEVYST